MICKSDKYANLDYQIQLIDFGFARSYQDSINDKEILGSPHYVAPEVLKQKYGYESDVWAIGVMLYFSIAFEYPFEGKDDEDLFRSINEDELKFEPKAAWEDIPKELKELISSMLIKDPRKRVDIESVTIHSAFKAIHEIEDRVSLTLEDKKKLNRYYKLSPIQRKFVRYSTKFLSPVSKIEHCEKFTLLDKENFGILKFTTDEEYDDSER